MRNSRLDLLTDYPFQRLADLLHGVAPGKDPLILSIGEPQHRPPAFVAEILTQQQAGWGKYPPMNGTASFRAAAADWARSRFGLAHLDPERHLLPLAGTREGLFQVAQLVLDAARPDKNLVLLPNPFYQVYAGAALIAGGEPVYVPATLESGFLPDFAALPPGLLDRVALAYFCSPANPQGAVASAGRLKQLVELARAHDFVLAADECYSEIYGASPPAGILKACEELGSDYGNVLAFHSLSKRSSAPGLRSGFVAGDAELIQSFARLRAYGGASVPLPILAASEALWRDESHVEENRALYRAKFDLADHILGGLQHYRRPAGGFFLWLDVGNGERMTRLLWRETGVKVLPGAYLGRPDRVGRNPGDAYIRVALVHDLDATERALLAIRALIGTPELRAVGA